MATKITRPGKIIDIGVMTAEFMEGNIRMDWDALAEYWYCFETDGFDMAILNELITSLNPPVLYIGGGRGSYPAQLCNVLGIENVTIVDSSLAMARQAASEFNLSFIVADACQLPVPDHQFASVLCVSGVMEHLDETALLVALQEMARACRKDGSLILAASVSNNPTETVPVYQDSIPGRELIYIHGYIDAWYRENYSLTPPEKKNMSSYNRLASAMQDRNAAYILLKNSFPKYAQLIDTEQFELYFQDRGLSIKHRHYKHEQNVQVWNLGVLK